ANVPAAGQGADVGKKIVGRKRSVVIDTTGLLLALLGTAASIQDCTAGETLLKPSFPRGGGKTRPGPLTRAPPPRHDLRDLLDAVLYVARTGIPWRYLPHDYPH
ncbi:hypothetical protein ADK44_19010, partial [Streptomyces rimosus subsp. rimosus]|uniref:transposase n=1 Tax=Streptomyces rimosus TaxID=1927 RepID=UPI0006C2DA71